jgi:hypothetical protein
MPFPVTANALFVSALLTGLAGVAPCQSDLSTLLVGCLAETSGTLILTDKDGGTYLLDGHTAELKAHIGDELSVSGRIRAAGRDSGDDSPFQVVSFTTVLTKNLAGVQPQLGDPADWSTFTDKSFGVAVRHPKTFLQQDGEPVWLPSNFVDRTGILTLHARSIPREAGIVYYLPHFKTASVMNSPSNSMRRTAQEWKPPFAQFSGLEPFSDGVEYHGGSKTITLEIAPELH